MTPKLNPDEQQLEQQLQTNQFVSDSTDLKLLNQAIKNHLELQKTKPITIRVPVKDLVKLKLKSEKLGLPYQTLINVLIKQFSSNQISLHL